MSATQETEVVREAGMAQDSSRPGGADDLVVAMAVLDGPLGPVHLAVMGSSVLALELRSTEDSFLRGLAKRAGREPVARGAVATDQRRLLDDIARRLDRFWSGRPESLDLPVDLRGLSPWDRRVLGSVRRVPWGEVTSYGRIALAIGARGAARAVGGAVGRNPIGLVVPCHRVIAGDGSIGGYGGSWFGSRDQLLDLKRDLLAIEGTRVPTKRLVTPPSGP
jgi:methylated-DNA-[protein]-cysteine S-methyltransferase